MSQNRAATREKIIQDYYDACEVQDWELISSFLHPDVVFQVAGNAPTRTVAALQARVVAALETAGVTEMSMKVDQYIHDRSGEQCVAEISVRLSRANGRQYAGPGCGVFRFDESDRIVRYQAYTDEGDFWA